MGTKWKIPDMSNRLDQLNDAVRITRRPFDGIEFISLSAWLKRQAE